MRDGKVAMAFKMMVLVRRKPGMSPAEFRAGYEGSHSRLGVRLYGHLWLAYRRNYLKTGAHFAGVRQGEGISGPDEIGFDAVSEFIVRDEAAFAEMQAISLANRAEIEEDEARWFDQVHSYIVPVETIEEDLGPARGNAG